MVIGSNALFHLITCKMEYITVISQLQDQRVISPTYKWSILGLLTIYQLHMTSR